MDHFPADIAFDASGRNIAIIPLTGDGTDYL
jgi:hypothetical protein